MANAPAVLSAAGTRAKLQRMANAFDKPELGRQYMDRLAWAARAFRESSKGGSHWTAWAAAIQ
eukprot:4689247-Lingulodinium_polyedra.AAC.1